MDSNLLTPQATERLYRVWGRIQQRCSNPSYPNYKTKYGGRGIRVCPEWKGNFMAFLKWALANGYEKNLILDRIDEDKNYCPENCQWSARLEQGHRRWREHNYRDPNAADDRWRSKTTEEVV